jgi:cell wall assembly regulator SMI1
MREEWKHLESWFSANWPEIIPDLTPGCDPGDFEKIESEIGVRLPDSFKEFYMIHDGQKAADHIGMFYGASLLPLAKILEQWRIWAAVIDEYGNEQMQALFDQYQASLLPAKVRAMYANKKWIPFAVIWDSNYIGLDFDPESEGSVGQVINFGREEEQKSVLSHSFDGFIERFIGELEKGETVFMKNSPLPKKYEWRFNGGRTRLGGYIAHRFIDEPSLEEQEKLGILL